MDKLIQRLHDRRNLLRKKTQNKLRQVILSSESLKLICELINISGDGISICVNTVPTGINKGDKISLYFPDLAIKNSPTPHADYIVKWYKSNPMLNQTTIGADLLSDPFKLNNHLFIKKTIDLDNNPDRRATRENENNIENRRKIQGMTGLFPLEIENTPIYRREGNERRKNFRDKDSATDRRKKKPDPEVRTHFVFQSIKSIVTVLRDLFLLKFHLPKFIVNLLIGKGDFVFVAHPRDFTDVSRMFPFANFIPEEIVKKWFYYQWPFIASKVTAIDTSTNKKISGWIVISPLWTTHMMKDNDKAREKILLAVKLAENINARVVGLGAFTSIVTHDGLDLLGKTKIGVTTGNPLSSAVAIANLSHALTLTGSSLNNSRIAIVGAAGSVGSGCARVLVKHAKELHLIDINGPKLGQLIEGLSAYIGEDQKSKITFSNNLSDLKLYDAVIVVTNATGAIVNEKHLKPGAIVIDCAQPKNVSKNVPIVRKDVLVIESAIISSPDLNCRFDLDLNRGEALGCLAECIVLSSIQSKKPMIIGKYDDEHIEEIYTEAQKIGINLAYFRNSHGYITEEDINRVKGVRKEQEN